MTYSPTDIFKDCDISEVLAWSKHIRYHDVHVTDSDYVVTYLDPTVYTAWCLYNTHSDLPSDYCDRLRSRNYRVCYFTNPYPLTQSLRKPITMSLTHDLFPDTEFTHRVIL